ncbi:hypothetical protein [Nonomuraea rosea]
MTSTSTSTCTTRAGSPSLGAGVLEEAARPDCPPWILPTLRRLAAAHVRG